ncbi:MAG TPA: DUF3800 domain-containing protein [Planctomycetota bacterium]|nr:DUF3800 domain-containing protein [Planctomycetota bacterium]
MTEHILFIDESGTHDMNYVAPEFPVFVLVGMLTGEKYYARSLVPRVKALKSRHGIDARTALHSYDIRRWRGEFAFLRNPERREMFYEDLNQLFNGLRVRFYAVTIDKRRLRLGYLLPPNPYDVSLSQLLSIICGSPGMLGVYRPNVKRIIAERRGKLQDKSLQHQYQVFRRVGLSDYGAADVQTRRSRTVRTVFPQRVEFAGKSKVVAGLELADLAAYPIARAYINQQWDNPAYLPVARKLRTSVVFP